MGNNNKVALQEMFKINTLDPKEVILKKLYEKWLSKFKPAACVVIIEWSPGFKVSRLSALRTRNQVVLIGTEGLRDAGQTSSSTELRLCINGPEFTRPGQSSYNYLSRPEE